MTTGMPSQPLALEEINGDGGRILSLEPGSEGLLGRDPSCAVVLEHPGVSRRHAVIAGTGPDWTVRDLSSRGGTLLNSIRLEPDDPHRLDEGDLLGVGDHTWIVRIGILGASGDEDEATGDREVAAEATADDRGTHATHPSIFLRLGADRTEVREMGWREFADTYGPIVMGFARRAGMDAQAAEDILQDVLIGFFRVASRFEYDPDRGRFRGYLKRITLNAIRMRWRKRPREVRLGTDVAHDDPGQDTLPTASEATWDSQWSAQLLLRAIEDTRQRFEASTMEAFELFGRRGLTAEAASEQLDMSVESIRGAKSRVAKAVRERFEALRAAEG